MTGLALGVLTGLALGAVTARGGLCFNSGLRQAAFEHRGRVMCAFGFAIAVQMLLLPPLVAAGLDLTRIGWFPIAQLAGGLVFGAGMALAGGCIAGILWKSGAGSIATAIAIGGFAAGELLIRGPGEPIASDFDAAGPQPAEATLFDVFGTDYAPLAIAIGAVAIAALARRSREGLALGIALGLVATGAWVAAAGADHAYGLGFAGSVEGTVNAIEDGASLSSVPFPAWVALGVLAGAYAAVPGPVRLPDRARATRALTGGLMMGIGATLAHGCNIGNGLTGIPLLALGSLWATAWMAIAALVTWRFVIAPRPAFRGVERVHP
jgi:uncharacterized membrane protein YedE/YeeE